jgi:uncharacterized membrane-anchored protein
MLSRRGESGMAMAKLPAVTLGFWIIKILATTLGETGGDTVSVTWLSETTPEARAAGLNGYLIGTALSGALLAGLVRAQIRRRCCSPGCPQTGHAAPWHSESTRDKGARPTPSQG